MNRIEIYSSKKKAGLLLIGSLAFVLCGIYEYVSSEDTLYKTLSILAILFFGLGVLISIWLLIKNRLALAIDNNGIFLYSAFGRYTSIDWKSIKGFVIQRIMITPSINTKKDFIIIELNNPEYWNKKGNQPKEKRYNSIQI